jgi:hypothetical protein
MRLRRQLERRTMIPEPDTGSHKPRPPGRAIEARNAANRGNIGGTYGAQMWFHEDMVQALTRGQHRAGWTGEIRDGNAYIHLTTFGARHTWVLTGIVRECPQMPNTVICEGIWPD